MSRRFFGQRNMSGYNFAKNLIGDNKAILENVHSTQYKKLLYAKVKK